MTGGGEGRVRVGEQDKGEHGGNLFLRTGSESEDEHDGVHPREEHGKGSGQMWVLVCGGDPHLAGALLP